VGQTEPNSIIVMTTPFCPAHCRYWTTDPRCCLFWTSTRTSNLVIRPSHPLCLPLPPHTLPDHTANPRPAPPSSRCWLPRTFRDSTHSRN